MSSFREFLAGLLSRMPGTKREFATKVGLSQSGLSHLLNGHYPSVEVCLRVAKATHDSPSKVLRLARKADVADLIEDLYGIELKVSRTPAFSKDQQRLIAIWEALPALDRRAILTIMEGLYDRVPAVVPVSKKHKKHPAAAKGKPVGPLHIPELSSEKERRVSS